MSSKKTKLLITITYLWWMILQLQYTRVKSQTVYPDFFSVNDQPFVDDLGSTVQIYKTGYFTNNPNAQLVYLQKYGITYPPDWTCDGSHAVDNTNANEFIKELIKKRDSTLGDQNQSELETLFQFTVSGVSMKSWWPIIQIDNNTIYTITHTFPVIGQGNINVSINVANDDPMNATKVCENIVVNGKVVYVKWIVTSPNRTSMKILCDNQKTTKTVANPLSEKNFDIIVSSTGSNTIYLSHYWITIDFSTSTTYTYNGLTTCTVSEECFQGFMCNGGKCVRCHSSCLYCDADASSPVAANSCRKCGVWSAAYDDVSAVCTSQYTDITQFENIKITDIPPPRTNRVTLGTWVFVSDVEKMKTSNNYFSISVKDFLMLSFSAAGAESMNVNCDTYIKYIPNIEEQTSYVDYNNKFAANKDTNRLTNTVSSIKARWFWAQCAMSFDHSEFYINTIKNNADNYQKLPLVKEKLYDLILNDVYFRTIFPGGVTQQLLVNNGKNLRGFTKVYLRNLILFQEYLPYQIHFMYHDFYKIFGAELYPELIFVLPFYPFERLASNYQTKYYTSNKPVTTLTWFQAAGTIDISAPKNFKRLPWLEKNSKFSDVTWEVTQWWTGTANNAINFEDMKSIKCGNGYWLNINTFVCYTGCEENRITYPGVGTNQGYCNYVCTSSMRCPNSLMSDLFTYHDPYSTTANFCTNSAFYTLYYSCADKTFDYSLYFSSYFTTGNIVLKNLPGLTSYFIELWYYPDFYLPKRINNIYFKAVKNYIFYSNAIRIFLNSQGYHQETSQGSNLLQNQYAIQPYEWNKIVAIVKYNRWKTQINLSISINNNIQSLSIVTKNSTGEDEFKLSYIIFCQSVDNSCLVPNVEWASGFYKNLRIWDGNWSHYYSGINYDIYYPSLTKRTDAIKGYYPWSKFYFADNKIYDPKYMTIDNWQNPVDMNELQDWTISWRLPLWNYSSKFDYIATLKPQWGFYLDKDGSLAAKPCTTGCARCWASDECYSCKTGYIWFFRTCKVANNFFLKSPSSNSVGKINWLKTIVISKQATITIWIKVFGFENPQGTIIQYSNNLDLYYNSDDKISLFGLNLRNDKNNNQIVSNVRDFRDLFGQWVFISLALYDDTSKQHYFPRMMKFEVNDISYAINYDNLGTSPSWQDFGISDDFYGFIYDWRVYSTYISGAYNYNINKSSPEFNFPSPILWGDRIYFPMGSNNENCYRSDDFRETIKYNCEPDYDDRFNLACSSYDSYVVGTVTASCRTRCPSTCRNKCVGSAQDQCACLITNYNSQMFFRNEEKHYCKKYDYINWAKADQMVLKPVLTAKMTKRYTLQFWFYAYTYMPNIFGGWIVSWEGHNEIQVTNKNNNNEYTFTCIPYIPYRPEDATERWSTTITINKWNFVSCATAFEFRTQYINTNNDNPYKYNTPLKVWDHPYPSKMWSETSTLTITDLTGPEYEEWGVLFYSQIHLWSEAYFNSEFLSRINIVTPTLFPYWLNTWEPRYQENANFENHEVIDIAGVAENNFVKNGGKIGVNIVDESTYVEWFAELCKDEGEYFDITTRTCLKFTDLSKMADFQFTNIPPSYSGNYALGTWFFTENFDRMSTGLSIIWKRHLQVTIVKQDDGLYAMCFPQEYYLKDEIPNIPISARYNAALNKDKMNYGAVSGVWIWVMCSVSFYNQEYYVNPSVKQKLYTEHWYDAEYSIYPLRYYISQINYSSFLKFENVANTLKIYFRSVQLFQDYIPPEYDFRYMDWYELSSGQMPSLVMVCNFANNADSTTEANVKLLKYKTFSPTETLQQVRLVGQAKEWSANFVFLPWCNPLSIEKYDEAKNLCVPIALCEKTAINASHCMGEATPLTCWENYFIRIDPTTNAITCATSCAQDMIRAPGTKTTQGICSTNCKGTLINELLASSNCPSNDLTNYSTGFTCSDTKISYYCIENTKVANSALYINRCYQHPNFFRAISNGSKQKFSSGYFYEFWFKLDTVNNNCARTFTREHYLYSTPHAIYMDSSTSEWIYEIIGAGRSHSLEGINTFEWNRIIIRTTLATLGQSVKVFVNYKLAQPDVTFTGIPSITNMQLQFISFCSSSVNGNCTSGGAAQINWGSAYYRNIRVWDWLSSSEKVLQTFTNEQFTEIPKSLILYYPLTIDKIDLNVLKDIVSGTDSIQATHTSTGNFKSSDNYSFYNYAINFDWGKNSEGNWNKYIASMDTSNNITPQDCNLHCRRCYSGAITYCYECDSGYVLIEQTCTSVTGDYLKLPVPGEKASVSIKIQGAELTKFNWNNFTITFYMKFLGVLLSGTSSQPNFLELNANTYLAYDIATTNLIMLQSNNVAFRDKNFSKYFGSWIQVSIGIHKSINHEVYPHIFTLSVNREDIPFTTSYKIPDSGIVVDHLIFGYEVIAWIYKLYIYNHFYQGAYGVVNNVNMSENDAAPNMFWLKGINSGCLTSSDLADGASISPQCVGDYNPYDDPDIKCTDSFYFDTSVTSLATSCLTCSNTCVTECFNAGVQECNCNIMDRYYWWRRHRTTKKTYCEFIPYIDFSAAASITVQPNESQDRPGIASSDTGESTIEFWWFVYSYNSVNNNFQEINVEWEKHNRVRIYSSGNSLRGACFALDSQGDNIDAGFTYYKWELIRCGTSLILIDGTTNPYNYFFNAVSSTFNWIGDKPVRGWTSNWYIYNGTKDRKWQVKMSYGFVFMRELKLWRQYNVKYIDSSYINIIYNYARYPGWWAYFKGEFKGFVENKIIDFYDEIAEKSAADISLWALGTASDPNNPNPTIINEFYGYNIVDPDNNGYYSDWKICDEGTFYNSATNTCIEPTLTHCEFPGDISDNCVTCDANEIFIYPVDGTCKTGANDASGCPVRYYPNDRINQCRGCHHTCYTCSGYLFNECLTCYTDGNDNLIRLYLVKSEFNNNNGNICVPICEGYGLTINKPLENKGIHECTIFYADIVPVNFNMIDGVYSTHWEMDIRNFNEIEAQILDISSATYHTEWGIDVDKTCEYIEQTLNGNCADYNLTPTPFTGNIRDLKTSLDTTYFKYDMKYYFYVDAYSTYMGESIVYHTGWWVKTNKIPTPGTIDITPSVGVYNTTTFLIGCNGWTDQTNTDLNEGLDYFFYAIEEGTSTIINLSNNQYQKHNEVHSNFTTVYYQQPSNRIKIYCKIRDVWEAEAVISHEITVVNSWLSNWYDVEEEILAFSIPEQVNDMHWLSRSEYLKSWGIDNYKALQPDRFQTRFEPSLDMSLITMKDPNETPEYCNGETRGTWVLADVFQACDCELGFKGRNCHMITSASDALFARYMELYNKLFREWQTSISDDQFQVIHNLYFAASQFLDIENTSHENFFSNTLDTYISLSMNLFTTSILNNLPKYIDLFDFYYSFLITGISKERGNAILSSLPYRNMTITSITKYKTHFKYVYDKLWSFLKLITTWYGTKKKTFRYESRNFFIGVAYVDPVFNDTAFFEDRKEGYHTYINFMQCLNFIEIEKLTNPYYSAWMIYIEYLSSPYQYNETWYRNNTSPIIQLQFIDATTGKEIIVSGCQDENWLQVGMPFNSYTWIDELNRQKWLHDPNNYKSPDDPIFSDPIYIDEIGFISNDTVEERIEKYNRLYNFSAQYWDTDLADFNDTGLFYRNFTADGNFIEFNSSHLTQFTTFFIRNNAEFKVQSRFFYWKRPQVFRYWPNYIGNYGFYIFMGFWGLYVFLVFVLTWWDTRYFKQESWLEFLKREIVRVFLPYIKNKDKEINQLVPSGFNPGIRPVTVFGDPLKGRKANLQNEKYLNTAYDADEKQNKKDVLNLNKTNGNDDESDEDNENGASQDENNNNNKGGNFFSGANRDGHSRKPTNNPFINDGDQDDLRTGKPSNKFAVVETDEQEYQKRWQSFADLNWSLFQFMCQNILSRHTIISPVINMSLFNPRWKKLTMLTTEVNIIGIMLSVQWTADETILTNNLPGIAVAVVIAVFVSNFILYLLADFFFISYSRRKKLYKWVISGQQLIILKEWEDMVCSSAFYTSVGLFIHFAIWAFSFYINVSFVAVWKIQAWAWLLSYIAAFIWDFIVLEIIVEFFIAIIFTQRWKNSCMRVWGEFWNRLRNYRCLWP